MARNKTDRPTVTRPAQPDRVEKRGGYSPAKVTDLSQVSNPSPGPAPGTAKPKAQTTDADTGKDGN